MFQNKTNVFYLFLLTLLWSQAVLSESKTINPLITYRCDTAADIIVITNSLLTPAEAQTFDFSDASGTYNPWDMVTIDHDMQKIFPLKDRTVIKKCTLSTGEYTTTIQPKIFSQDITGKCGTSISGTVTIEFGGIEIFEKRPFEDYCHGNAPIITRITVFGETSETKIKRIPKYKFY